MRALDRKLLRDVRRIWTQLLAIAAVIAAGVAVCLTMLSASASLHASRDGYYLRSRFADAFAPLKRAPEAAAARLREIPGVDLLETRIAADVTLDVGGVAEPVIGRLLSLPDEGEPLLNTLLLREGSYPAAGRGDEVLVSEAFAAAHALHPGGRIAAIVNGRWRRLAVTGIVLSPEYVYSIRAGEMFPDDRRFGEFWMRRRDLAAAFDLDGAFNDAVFRLRPGADTAAVLAGIDRVLARYGGLGAYARRDQTSAWYLENELSQLANMGRVTPFIFAGVAAFLLHVVLSRLVAAQRGQIGVLRAFGYTRGAIARHYLVFALVIAAAGIVIGLVIGAWAGAYWTRLYALFFRFPTLAFRLPASLVVGAAGTAAALAGLSACGAALHAARIAPADAMRPPAPATYRRGLLERLRLDRAVPLTARMVVRNLERRPLRALLSIAAMALAIAIVIVGIFTVDAVHYLTDVQFNAAQRQDAAVAFADPRSRAALHEAARLPGVIRAEPVRTIAVKLSHGPRARRVAIVGLEPQAVLARVVDANLRPVALPESGLLLNDALAAALGASPGDALSVEVLEGARPITSTTVAAVVPEFMGLSAYMRIDAANRLMREGSVLSGVYLQIDPAAQQALYARIKRTPRVAGLTVSDLARRSFEDTLAAVITAVTAMFALFGAAIAFAVIYNNSRIAFAERARELGSLHVLGFSHREMAEVLLGETALLTLAGIPVGLLAGRLLGALVVTLFSTELARIPLVIAPATNGTAVAIALVAAALSAGSTWRQLVRLDAVSVLKAPE